MVTLLPPGPSVLFVLPGPPDAPGPPDVPGLLPEPEEVWEDVPEAGELEAEAVGPPLSLAT